MYRQLIIVLLLCLTPFVAVPAAAQTSPPVADVEVAPAEGPPGTLFSFYAAGFRRLEEVHYWATAPDGSVDQRTAGTDTADDIGRARWNWTAPTGAQAGRWLMVAYAPESGTQQLILFTITPEGTTTPPPVNQPIGVTPEVGRPGTTFVFFAGSFALGERVQYWATAPDGSVDPATAGQAIALTNGRAEWTWKAPAAAQPGRWLMVAHGLQSGLELVIPFTVE